MPNNMTLLSSFYSRNKKEKDTPIKIVNLFLKCFEVLKGNCTIKTERSVTTAPKGLCLE